MKFILTPISMDNAAFEEAPATELAEMFERIATAVRRGATEGTCRDSNGNKVGQWRVEG